jgi:hypothetical protein
MEATLKRKQWLLGSNKINDRQKLNLWQSLFRSRVNYAAELLCHFSTNIKQWLLGYNYRSMKMLMGIRGNPNKLKLLKECLGEPWQCHMQTKSNKTLNKLGIKVGDTTTANALLRNKHSL